MSFDLDVAVFQATMRVRAAIEQRHANEMTDHHRQCARNRDWLRERYNHFSRSHGQKRRQMRARAIHHSKEYRK